jgi:hypothetical protein
MFKIQAAKYVFLRNILCAAMTMWFGSAYAYLQDEIQVYDDEINSKGEYSLELHANTTPRGNTGQSYPGEIISNGNTRLTPELAYGLGHHLEAGYYMNTVVNNGTWNYAGSKVRLKWLPILEDEGHAFFGGVNFEVSDILPQYEQNRYVGEARFILGKHIDEWLIAINPILDVNLSSPRKFGSPDLNFAARVSREVSTDWALGVEYYSNTGAINVPTTYQNTTGMGFLVAYYEGKPMAFQLGIGQGLTAASDSLTIKGIFSIPLP